VKRHVDLLSTLYILWGAIALLASLAVIALGLGVAAVIASSNPGDPASRLTASVAAGLFGALAVLGILCGSLHLWSAFAIRRGREWARLFSLVLAVFDLFVPPLGTGLGVYAFWVLTSAEVRAAFESSSA
jgi:hypothetical protein